MFWNNEDEEAEGTEAIEATFGEIQVFATGSDPETVRENFEFAWKEVRDMSDDMYERSEDREDNSGHSSRMSH